MLGLFIFSFLLSTTTKKHTLQSVNKNKRCCASVFPFLFFMLKNLAVSDVLFSNIRQRFADLLYCLILYTWKAGAQGFLSRWYIYPVACVLYLRWTGILSQLWRLSGWMMDLVLVHGEVYGSLREEFQMICCTVHYARHRLLYRDARNNNRSKIDP